MSETKNEGLSFLEEVVDDDVKRRLIGIAYGTCENLEDLDEIEVGIMIGAVFAYGMQAGLVMAREGTTPTDQDLSAFSAAHPEILAAAEKIKQRNGP